MLIRGREYTVLPTKDMDESRCVYWLTGKRGARYFTVRNRPNPDLMFIVPEKFIKSNVLDRVWLTDVTGELKVVRQ